MSVTMQGTWTVKVKSKSAVFPQRFVIAGADAGNGVYAGETTTPQVVVTGSQWTITVQHNPTGPVSWITSAMRIGTPTTSLAQILVDIRSNDTGGDVDYNDLVLTCSMAPSPSEYVVYGSVRTYSGLCFFNPCFPLPWVVIDSLANLKEALKYPQLANILEEFYPERVKPLLARPGVFRPPRPEPDPEPFIPLMVPLGRAPAGEQRVSFQFNELGKTALEAQPAAAARRGASAAKSREVEATSQPMMLTGLPASTRVVRLELGSAVMESLAPYARDVSKFIDKFKVACSVENAPGVLLRFLEYDRTADELAGGPYTGSGSRLVLGLAATDEQGNYIFRFSRSLEELGLEFSDIVAGGAPLAAQLQPDLLVQVIGAGPSAVLYESGLFGDVPNLKRIDLCLPDNVLNPGPTACQGGRAIQAIGNIFTIPGVGNTLFGDGRITATNPTGPQITRGAWAGRLDLFGCFLDLPVKYYTIRFRRPPAGPWSPVQELYTHIKFSDIAPGYTGTKVGPDTRNLAVNGGPKIDIPSYLNIEADPEWLVTQRIRKVQLSSSYYENLLYGPDENPRSVEFRIEGYNAAGDKVPGADDNIVLLVDNRAVTGDIDDVSMGAVSPGECALFELPSPNAPLTVRFKVNQSGGFVRSYSLSVIRGSNTGVPVSDTTLPAQPLSVTYSEPVHGDFFFGTLDAVGPDADGYVLAELQADAGAWLPADRNFCAFEFLISCSPRTTNGYGVFGGYDLDKELVGISYTPPGP